MALHKNSGIMEVGMVLYIYAHDIKTEVCAMKTVNSAYWAIYVIPFKSISRIYNCLPQVRNWKQIYQKKKTNISSLLPSILYITAKKYINT